MQEEAQSLFAQYVINGVRMDDTPFSALLDVLDGKGSIDVPEEKYPDIVDERLENAPDSFEYDSGRTGEYVRRILDLHKTNAADVHYPETCTAAAIDDVLLEALFRSGHFKLEDLLLMIKWNWNFEPAGHSAAFHASAVTAGEHLFGLGVKLDRYFVDKNSRKCTIDVSLRSSLSSRKACPDRMSVERESDYLIYVPFDNGRLLTGGSALSRICGENSGPGRDCPDNDYFMDCYEVVREMAEDGILVAGVPVGYGGLACAAEKFRGRCGFRMNVSGIAETFSEDDIIKILFNETPGVIIQIKDDDFDYVDSQFLLQDIAYCVIGHPSATMRGMEYTMKADNSIGGIIDSLMSRLKEGED